MTPETYVNHGKAVLALRHGVPLVAVPSAEDEPEVDALDKAVVARRTVVRDDHRGAKNHPSGQLARACRRTDERNKF